MVFFPLSHIADLYLYTVSDQQYRGISCRIRVYIEDDWSPVLSPTTCWVAALGISQATRQSWPKDAAEAPIKAFTGFKEEQHMSNLEKWWRHAPVERISIK